MRLNQEELLNRFVDYLQYEKRYSAHTLESYLRDCKQLRSFLAEQYGMDSMAEATHHQIRSWVVSLLKKENLSTSVRRKLSSIAHLYKWMRRMDMIDHNPVVKVQLPKIPERLPKSLPAAVIHQLWDSMHPVANSSEYSPIRDRTLIGLLYGCGLRRSEVIKLTWNDFDKERKLLRVMGKGRKYRQIPVGDGLAALLKSLNESAAFKWKSSFENEIILMDNGKPCYPKFVHNRVVGMLGTVTTAEKKSPHVLRHSMATHMMDQGAELNAVKAILGHSSLAATQVYTHNSISRIKEVYKQSHPNAKNHG